MEENNYDIPDRYFRMRSAWADLRRKNMTRLTFAQFEERMLTRDLGIKKSEYYKRRIVVDGKTETAKAILKLIAKN